MSCQTPLLPQIFTCQEDIDSSPQFATLGDEEQQARGGPFKTWRTPSSTPEDEDSSLYESYLTAQISKHDMRHAKNSCEHFLTQFEELGYDIEEIDESMDYTPEWPEGQDFSFSLHPQSSHKPQTLRPLQPLPNIMNQHAKCRKEKKQLNTKISQLQVKCGQLAAVKGEVRRQVERWQEETKAKVQSELKGLLKLWEGWAGEIKRQSEAEMQEKQKEVESMRRELEEAISANRNLTLQLTKSDENQQVLGERVQQLEEELALLQEQSEELFARNCQLQRANLRLSQAEEELALMREEQTEQHNYVADLEEKVADLEYQQMQQMGNLESELMEYRDTMEEEFRSRWGELRGIFEQGEKVRVEIEAAHLEGLEVEANKLRELISIKAFLEDKILEVAQGYERTSRQWRYEPNTGGKDAGLIVELLKNLKQSVVWLFRSKERVFWTNHESLNQINALYRQLHAYFKENCFSHPDSRILERVPSDHPPLSDSTFHSLNTTPPSKSQDNFYLKTQSTCIADPQTPPHLPWGPLENSLLLITHRLHDVRQRLRDSLSASCP